MPICNSLTFVFTAITSRLLGEKPKRPICAWAALVLCLVAMAVVCVCVCVRVSGAVARVASDTCRDGCPGTYAGMFLILLGVLICFDSKN